jgi:hypothetical protein
MVVPVGGADKCRQPLPPGLLHDYVQRFGMVSPALSSNSRTPEPPSYSTTRVAPLITHMLILRQ